MGFVEGATTIGTAFRQLRFVSLIDLFGAAWWAVSLSAIVLPRLASRLARIELGLALGEGSGLAFTGAARLVELTAEAFVLGLKVVDPSLEGLAVGAPNRLHTGIIRSSETCSCTGGRGGIAQLEERALIKYGKCFSNRNYNTVRGPERVIRAHARGGLRAHSGILWT
jgi:hypothetical protein